MAPKVLSGLADLPFSLFEDERDAFAQAAQPPRLKDGSWLVTYRSADSTSTIYDGVIRVTSGSELAFVSGDLFKRPVRPLDSKSKPESVEPKPQDGIPVLPLSTYSSYLQFTKLHNPESPNGTIDMLFFLWDYTRTEPWKNSGLQSMSIGNGKSPDGVKPTDYLTGFVKNASGVRIASIVLQFVSKYYRKASLEIATVPGVKPPMDNGSGLTWRTVFENAGIDMKVTVADANIPEPVKNPGVWKISDLNDALVKWRSKTGADTNVKYLLLVVKKYEEALIPRGIMFDDNGKQGASVATNWIIPQSSPAVLGTFGGKTWGSAVAPFFRTAVHEIGHAMGLPHNVNTQTFMDDTITLANSGEKGLSKFPTNIRWEFAEDDVRRIHHWPEIYIRPGGLPYPDLDPYSVTACDQPSKQ